MHKAQQRVAVGNLQHIIAIFQHGIGRDQSKTGLDPRPILGIGFGVVERIGLFEEVTRRTKAVLFNDVIVVLRTVGASSGGPSTPLSIALRNSRRTCSRKCMSLIN